MNMRFLGTTGLRVSELCFGAMTFGNTSFWKSIGGLAQDDADRLIQMACDGGINFFDTADVYSDGLSEKLLAHALKDRRNDVILATKVYFPMGPEPNNKGLSRHHILEGCHASLKRLATDYIDLYQVHSFDPMTSLDETLRALDDLVRQGKVRYIGCSNYASWQLMKALAISEKFHLNRYISTQCLYSLIARDVEDDIIPLCHDQGVGFIAWSPLGWGFLTGKNRHGQRPPEGTRRATKSGHLIPFDEEKGFRIVDVLDRVATEHGVSIPQAAINYILHKPGVTSVIIGARTPDQLADNLKAADWKMRPEFVAELDKASDRVPHYPIWHQKRSENER